jgi:undecaprenyl-diphosphatase
MMSKYLTLLLAVPFLHLCWQVINKNYPPVDSQILQLIHDRQASMIDNFFIVVYQISGAYITGVIVAIALAVFIYKRYWQEAKGLVFNTLGILILVDQILKPFFDRRRPPKPRLVENLSRESFPSGHSAGNLVLYFYLSLILAARYPHLTKYIYGLATAIVLVVGSSSIYTNAHWATDILAGYVFGYVWLSISLSVLKFTDRRQPNKP